MMKLAHQERLILESLKVVFIALEKKFDPVHVHVVCVSLVFSAEQRACELAMVDFPGSALSTLLYSTLLYSTLLYSTLLCSAFPLASLATYATGWPRYVPRKTSPKAPEGYGMSGASIRLSTSGQLRGRCNKQGRKQVTESDEGLPLPRILFLSRLSNLTSSGSNSMSSSRRFFFALSLLDFVWFSARTALFRDAIFLMEESFNSNWETDARR